VSPSLANRSLVKLYKMSMESTDKARHPVNVRYETQRAIWERLVICI
jgi:hypothetical protein